MPPEENNIEKKVIAIKQLLDMFRMERMIYLSVTILALIVLFICAIFLLTQKPLQIAAVVALFASGGAVTFTCSRLLTMWSDAIQLVGNLNKE